MTDYAAPALMELLAPDERSILAGLGQRRTFADGALIHARGDPEVAMGVVVRGVVKLYRQLRDGRQLLVVTVNPGQHYADVNMFEPNPRTHHALAVGTTVVDYYPQKAFLELLEHPGIVRALYRVTSYRLTQAVTMLDDIRSAPPEVRLAKILTVMQASADGAGRIDCRQHELANLLGVSAMTLAKAIKTLRHEQVIETGYRYVTIPDGARLQSWIEQSDWD